MRAKGAAAEVATSTRGRDNTKGNAGNHASGTDATQERRWLRRADQHMKLMARLTAELKAMDRAWPYIEIWTARQIKARRSTPIGKYLADLDRVNRRIGRLQELMQRHMALPVGIEIFRQCLAEIGRVEVPV
jgi:hypothetical protein